MLLFVRSQGLVFTACITSTLRRTVKGQVMVLMIIEMIVLTSTGTLAMSPSPLVEFETFSEIAREKFTMSSLKPKVSQSRSTN